jgi:RND family efflux transporter MFP subunit
MLKKLILPVLAIVLLLILVLLMAGVFSEKIEPGTSKAVMNKANLKEHESFVVTVENTLGLEAVAASINAKQATLISSRLLARIMQIHVRSGDVVEQGQIVIELEQSDLKSRVSQAKANSKAVEARLQEAKNALQRANDLHSKGVFSKADLDKALASHDALEADLLSAKQKQQEAQTLLEYSIIRSPIDGVVVDRFAEPGDTAQPGVQLLSLYNPNSLRLEANVREALALKLQLQQQVKVVIPSLKLEVKAEIEEIVPAGNPGSRSFQVKARLASKAGLLPGMYAELLLETEPLQQITVPKQYVATVGQLNIVWLLNSHNNIEKRFVRVGKAMGNNIGIISGVASGDRLLLPPKSSR